MPFENRFITAQRGPTTYRFLGADLKTAKNKVQAKNVSAPVPTPAPIKPPVRPEGDRGRGGEGGAPNTGTGGFKSGFTADLGEVTMADFGTPAAAKGALAGFIGGMGSIVGAATGATYGAMSVANARNQRERASRRASFQDSFGSQSPVAAEQTATRAAMTQATKAPTQNVQTGAERGGGGGVEAGIRGPGGRGSESFGQPGRGSTGGGRDNGGFDNGGFSRDSGFGGWT